MFAAIKSTAFKTSVALNVVSLAFIGWLVYGAGLKVTFHATAGNDDIAATEQQHNERLALSQVLPDQVHVPAHKPKVKP